MNSPFWIICGSVLAVPALQISELSCSHFLTLWGENREAVGHCVWLERGIVTVKAFAMTFTFNFLVSFFFFFLLLILPSLRKNKFGCLRHLSSGLKNNCLWTLNSWFCHLEVSFPLVLMQKWGGEHQFCFVFKGPIFSSTWTQLSSSFRSLYFFTLEFFKHNFKNVSFGGSPCIGAMPVQNRRGHRSPWSWGHRQLVATCGGGDLGAKVRSLYNSSVWPSLLSHLSSPKKPCCWESWFIPLHVWHCVFLRPSWPASWRWLVWVIQLLYLLLEASDQ